MIDFPTDLKCIRAGSMFSAKALELGNREMVPETTLLPIVRVNVIPNFHSSTKKMETVSPIPVINKAQGDASPPAKLPKERNQVAEALRSCVRI